MGADGGGGREEVRRRAVYVPSIIYHRSTSFVSLFEDVVKQVILEIIRGGKGPYTHAHDLPPFGDGLWSRIVRELFDDL